MASQGKTSVKKMRKSCVSGTALRGEAVLERVSGELAGTAKVYLDPYNSEFESITCCSSLSTSVIKRSVRDLLIYLLKRLSSLGKNTPRFRFGGMNMYGWEARKLVQDSYKDGDIVRSMVVGHRLREKWQRKHVRIDVWIITAKQITAIDDTEDKKKEKVCLVISDE